MKSNQEREIEIQSEAYSLKGVLGAPNNPKSVILFAHGSGSGRLSPRNNYVARELQKSGHATLLLDLLTEEESFDKKNVFDINLLAQRLNEAKAWILDTQGESLDIGLFGASTGAAAAIIAAARDPENLYALVSRGGRPDLAGPYLGDIRIPSLFIVGARDYGVIELNKEAYRELGCEKSLKLVPDATHLFEEPGALENVAAMAVKWFDQHWALLNQGSARAL